MDVVRTQRWRFSPEAPTARSEGSHGRGADVAEAFSPEAPTARSEGSH